MAEPGPFVNSTGSYGSGSGCIWGFYYLVVVRKGANWILLTC